MRTSQLGALATVLALGGCGRESAPDLSKEAILSPSKDSQTTHTPLDRAALTDLATRAATARAEADVLSLELRNPAGSLTEGTLEQCFFDTSRKVHYFEQQYYDAIDLARGSLNGGEFEDYLRDVRILGQQRFDELLADRKSPK